MIGSMVPMVLVGEAEHTEAACAALHTVVVEEVVAVAVAVAVAVDEPAVVEEVGPVAAACCDAAPVPVETGCPLHGSSHSTPVLLP